MRKEIGEKREVIETERSERKKGKDEHREGTEENNKGYDRAKKGRGKEIYEEKKKQGKEDVKRMG
jgi:hypothetical protein